MSSASEPHGYVSTATNILGLWAAKVETTNGTRRSFHGSRAAAIRWVYDKVSKY